MDKLVLRHRPPLENHLIGNDHIPADPRDLFIRMGCVHIPSIWIEAENRVRSFPTLPLNNKKKSDVLRSNLRTTVVF